MEITRKRRLIIVGAAAAIVAVGTGVGVAVAGGSDDGELPITGPDLERASAVALSHTGGGRVTETEVGDEESYYEVEVTLDGGGQVDVQLDEDFNVVDSTEDVEEDSDTD